MRTCTTVHGVSRYRPSPNDTTTSTNNPSTNSPIRRSMRPRPRNDPVGDLPDGAGATSACRLATSRRGRLSDPSARRYRPPRPSIHQPTSVTHADRTKCGSPHRLRLYHPHEYPAGAESQTATFRFAPLRRSPTRAPQVSALCKESSDWAACGVRVASECRSRHRDGAATVSALRAANRSAGRGSPKAMSVHAHSLCRTRSHPV